MSGCEHARIEGDACATCGKPAVTQQYSPPCVSPSRERQMRTAGLIDDVPSALDIDRLRNEIRGIEIEIAADAERMDRGVPEPLARSAIEIDIAGGGTAGVYFLIRGEDVVYIGSSNNVLARVGQHTGERGTPVGKDFDRAVFVECNADDRLDLEGALIRLMRPEYNGNAPANNGNDEAILAALNLAPHSKTSDLVRKRDELARLSRLRKTFLSGEWQPQQQQTTLPLKRRRSEPRPKSPPQSKPAWREGFEAALRAVRQAKS